MSQQQINSARTVQIPVGGVRSQRELALDLTIIEAGLRLKVLPLRDAIVRARKLNFCEVERRTRRLQLFALCGNVPLNVVDVGLFADAVARRPELAERLWRAARPSALR